MARLTFREPIKTKLTTLLIEHWLIQIRFKYNNDEIDYVAFLPQLSFFQQLIIILSVKIIKKIM